MLHSSTQMHRMVEEVVDSGTQLVAMGRDLNGTDKRTHHTVVAAAAEMISLNRCHRHSQECSGMIVLCTDCTAMFLRMFGRLCIRISAKRRAASCSAQVDPSISFTINDKTIKRLFYWLS